MPEILKLSKSKIEVWNKCRLQYAFKYRDKLPSIDTIPMMRGRALHAIVSTYTLHCCREKTRTDLDSIKRIIPTIMVEMRIPRSTEKDNLIREITDIILEYVSSHPIIWERITPNSVETMVEMMIGKYILVRGIPDNWEIERSTDTLIVTDYKSGHRIMTEKEVQADLSLTVFALLVIDKYFKEANHIVKRMDFIRKGHIVEVECYKADLEEGLYYLEAMGNAIIKATKENDFPPSPGACCDECGYANYCTYKMNNVDDVQSLARSVLVRRNQLEMDMEKLRKHVDINGRTPIVENGITFDYWTQNKNHYNWVKLIEFLEERDLDVNYYLSNKDRLEKYKPELLEKGILHIVGRSVFEGKKTKGE